MNRISLQDLEDERKRLVAKEVELKDEEEDLVNQGAPDTHPR